MAFHSQFHPTVQNLRIVLLYKSADNFTRVKVDQRIPAFFMLSLTDLLLRRALCLLCSRSIFLLLRPGDDTHAGNSPQFNHAFFSFLFRQYISARAKPSCVHRAVWWNASHTQFSDFYPENWRFFIYWHTFSTRFCCYIFARKSYLWRLNGHTQIGNFRWNFILLKIFHLHIWHNTFLIRFWL